MSSRGQNIGTGHGVSEGSEKAADFIAVGLVSFFMLPGPREQGMAYSGCPPRVLCLPDGTPLGHAHVPYVFTERLGLALCPPLGSKVNGT